MSNAHPCIDCTQPVFYSEGERCEICTSRLIEPGWPRPKNADGYPIPYIADSPDALGMLSTARRFQCATEGLCVVCGLAITDDRCAVALTRGEIIDDNGLSHLRCARLAQARCPHFNGTHERTEDEDSMSFVEIETARAKELVWIQHCRRAPVALDEVPGTLVT